MEIPTIYTTSKFVFLVLGDKVAKLTMDQFTALRNLTDVVYNSSMVELNAEVNGIVSTIEDIDESDTRLP